MSADNGIYILRTRMPPLKQSDCYINQHDCFEYRVAHCQAIDNLDYSDLYMPALFGEAFYTHSEDKAWEHARKIAQDCPVLEYGIQQINVDKYFPNITRKAAWKALDCYVGAEPVDI